jgi:hypothetical protein
LRLAVNEWPDSIQNDSSPGKLQVGKWTCFAVTYDGTRSGDNVSWYFSAPMDAPGLAALALDRKTSYHAGPVATDIGPLAIGNFNPTMRSYGLDRQFRGEIRALQLFGSRVGGRGALTGSIVLFAGAYAAQPIRLHPDNPRWFEWRGKAMALITSAEHYGAVLNLDFDFRRYLETLERDRLNYTRIFAGSYVEPPGAFGIQRNTLAPAPGRFIAPWARSDQPGYAGGGNKFDLDRFSMEYLARLKEFIREAGRRGVVVEFTLFCATYNERQWSLHPLNPTNNVQGIAVPNWRELHTRSPQPAMTTTGGERAYKKAAEEETNDSTVQAQPAFAYQAALTRWLVRDLTASTIYSSRSRTNRGRTATRWARSLIPICWIGGRGPMRSRSPPPKRSLATRRRADHC